MVGQRLTNYKSFPIHTITPIKYRKVSSSSRNPQSQVNSHFSPFPLQDINLVVISSMAATAAAARGPSVVVSTGRPGCDDHGRLRTTIGRRVMRTVTVRNAVRAARVRGRRGDIWLSVWQHHRRRTIEVVLHRSMGAMPMVIVRPRSWSVMHLVRMSVGGRRVGRARVNNARPGGSMVARVDDASGV